MVRVTMSRNINTYLSVNTEPLYLPGSLATPHGHRLGGGGGGEFFVLADKGFYLLFDSFAVAILLCSESPVISVSDITFFF